MNHNPTLPFKLLHRYPLLEELSVIQNAVLYCLRQYVYTDAKGTCPFTAIVRLSNSIRWISIAKLRSTIDELKEAGYVCETTLKGGITQYRVPSGTAYGYCTDWLAEQQLRSGSRYGIASYLDKDRFSSAGSAEPLTALEITILGHSMMQHPENSTHTLVHLGCDDFGRTVLNVTSTLRMIMRNKRNRNYKATVIDPKTGKRKPTSERYYTVDRIVAALRSLQDKGYITGLYKSTDQDINPRTKQRDEVWHFVIRDCVSKMDKKIANTRHLSRMSEAEIMAFNAGAQYDTELMTYVLPDESD